MTSLRKSHTFIFALIASFIMMQWSNVHIHLIQKHDHDGGHHQHEVDAHGHQSIFLNTDEINLSKNDHITSIVEVENDCSTSIVKKQERSIAFIVPAHQSQPLILFVSIGRPELLFQEIRPLEYSPLNPRAPPVYF